MKLIDALKVAFKVATGKHKNLPAINHIRLSPGLLEATDLALWLRLKVDYNGPEAILPVLPIKDALRKAKRLEIQPASTPGRFSINNGTVTTEVQGFDPESYPNLPIDPASLVAVPGCFSTSRFARAHARLEGFYSKDETRYVLQQYLLEVHPEGLEDGALTQGAARLIATNGHILATATVRAVGTWKGKPQQHLLSPQALDLALAAQDDGFLSVAGGVEANKGWTLLKNDACEIYTPFDAASEFPQWRAVVPSGGLLTFSLLGSELLNVLEATPSKLDSVHLGPDGQTCVIGWADEASEGKLTVRATLAQRKAPRLGSENHPRLHLSACTRYLKTLAVRSPKALAITIGCCAKAPDLVKGFSEQPMLCVDAEQQDSEVTVLMPMRHDKNALEGEAPFEAALKFLTEHAVAHGVFTPKAMLDYERRQLSSQAHKLDDEADDLKDAYRYHEEGSDEEREGRVKVKALVQQADALWERVFAIEQELAATEPKERSETLDIIKTLRRRLRSYPEGGLTWTRIRGQLKQEQKLLAILRQSRSQTQALAA